MSAAVVPIPPVPLAPALAASPLLRWAELNAAAGLPPIAIRPADKMPLTKGWQSATLEETCAHLQANPSANLGIAVPAGYVVLDVDNKHGVDGYATLEAFELEHGPLPPTLRARTPSGGAHYWFSVPDGMPVPNATGFAPGLDTRSGGKGLVVVEPSVTAAGAYRWENWGTPIALIPGWLLLAMRSKKPEAAPSAPGEPLCIPQGKRNSVLFERASTMRAAGLSLAVIHSALSTLNRESCFPPLDDAEVHATAVSACTYARGPVPSEVFGGAAPLPPGALAEKPRTAEWSLVPLQAEWNPFEPQPHLVDKWIPQDEVTLLAGHGGGGKSYVALSIAVHVALGRSFGPLQTKQANVLFYSAEDGAKVLQSRLARLCRHLEVSSRDLAGKLILLDASDIDPTLFRKSPLPALERLATAAKEHSAALVVIDNASDAFDGDEIKRAEVRAFIRAVRSLLARPDRAVLLLAHVNKLNARGGGEEDYSGSTAWHNSVRSRLSLKPGLHNTLAIEHAKANHGPKAETLQFVWKDGVPIVASSAPVDHMAHAERREQQRQGVVEIIRSIERRGGRVPTAPTGAHSTYKRLSDDAAFPKELDRKTLVQLLAELQGDGRIYLKVVTTPGRKQVEVYSCDP